MSNTPNIGAAVQITLIPDNSIASAPAGLTAAVEAAASVFEQDFPGNYNVNISYGWGTFVNGDGFSDLLWQNTSGQAAIWEMDGTNVLSSEKVVTNPGPSWLALYTATERAAYAGRAISSTRSARRSAASATPTDFAAAAAASSLAGAASASRRIAAKCSGVNSFCGTTIAPPDLASAAAFAA